MVSALDRIERSTVIRSPRSRVWRALIDAGEFCRWFHCQTSASAFEAGAEILMSSTYPGPHYGVKFSLRIVEVKPEESFAWQWHPNAHEATEDLAQEPMTTVTFRLEEVEGGTRVTVTESGFDKLFESRRQRAIESNTGGWKIQLANFDQYCSAQS